MKKFIIITVIAILLLGGAGYFLIVQRPSKPSPQIAVEEKPTPAPAEQSTTQSSPKTSFNTNDNLDEALQDLGQLDQF